MASRPQVLESPLRLGRGGQNDLLIGRGRRGPLSQAASNALRCLPGKRRSSAAEGAEADSVTEAAPDQAGSAAAGADSGTPAGQAGSAEAAGAGAAPHAQPAEEAAAAEAGSPAPAVHGPGAAAAEAELQPEVTWSGFRPTGPHVEGRMAAGAADVTAASPSPGSQIVLPPLEAGEHETMAGSKRLSWATVLQTRRHRNRAAAAAQRLAGRRVGDTQQVSGLELLQAADMPQAGRGLADRRDVADRERSASPGADLSRGEVASIVAALGTNASVLASSPPASPWQSGQGLPGLNQADLEMSRHAPGGAGQPGDQEANSAGLPRSSPAADLLAAAAAAAAGRAVGKEADSPASLPDPVWQFELCQLVARRSKVSSKSAAASRAGQQGNAVILDCLEESLPPANTEAAAQAAAEGSAGMSDTTEAASEAISDPDATEPTSPPPPFCQAPCSAAQSGGSQAVPGATTSGPWGSFGTTGPGHSGKSAVQEDADGATATSKVRSPLFHMHLCGDLWVLGDMHRCMTLLHVLPAAIWCASNPS